MIGNDIIDLNETRKTSNWERPGFMQKIFSIREQEMIYASANPFTKVWQLWSMKESAYKVFIQAGGERFFNPSKIECRINTSNCGQVILNRTLLNTSTSFHSNYLFTTAISAQSAIETRIFELAESNSSYQSNFMHEQVLTDFAKNNSIDIADISLQKTSTGVPVLYLQNKPLSTSLSISHHGNYGAYSILM